MKSENIHLLIEFIIILIIILTCNIIFDYHLFSKSIWTWTALIGLSFIAIAPLNFLLFSIHHAVINVSLGAFIAILSALIETNVNPQLDPIWDSDKIKQIDELTNIKNPNAHWSISIYWKNKNATYLTDTDSVDITFKGSTEQVNKYIHEYTNYWNKLHPNSIIIETKKNLL